VIRVHEPGRAGSATAARPRRERPADRALSLQRRAGNRALVALLQRVKSEHVIADDGATFDVQVDATAVTPTDLVLTTKHSDPDEQDKATRSLASRGVSFSAWVTTTTLANPGNWKLGWIQTVEPVAARLHYSRPDNAELGYITYTLANRMRDGNPVPDPDAPPAPHDPDVDAHGAWYDERAWKPLAAAASQAAAVKMSDEPNLPFHYTYKGRAAKAEYKNWRLVRTEGKKVFCTWLVAYPANACGPHDTPSYYLYYVKWEIDFDARVSHSVLTGGATRILSEGPGRGTSVPELGAAVDESDFLWAPGPKTPGSIDEKAVLVPAWTASTTPGGGGRGRGGGGGFLRGPQPATTQATPPH
jgi:hypothetical protein